MLIEINAIYANWPDDLRSRCRVSNLAKKTKMRLDASKLHLSTLAVFAMVWTVCTAFVLFMPVGMMRLSGYMAHLDIQGFS